jgi:hypothetical protein
MPLYVPPASGGSDVPLVFAPDVGIAPTARSFACKGNIFTPSASMTVRGLRVRLDAAAAYTLKGHVVTVSSNAIATISSTAEYTHDSAGFPTDIDLLFEEPVALVEGVEYGLMVGLSTSAGSANATTNLPVQTYQRLPWHSLYPRAGTFSTSVYHVASLTPVVSTAVTTATNDQLSGARTYIVGPIFDFV